MTDKAPQGKGLSGLNDHAIEMGCSQSLVVAFRDADVFLTGVVDKRAALGANLVRERGRHTLRRCETDVAQAVQHRTLEEDALQPHAAW